MPLEAVYWAGLAVGGAFDRAAARLLRRELRRLGAREQRSGLCAAATTPRPRSSGGSPSGARRLRCGGRRVEAVQRAGLVDDRRFAPAGLRFLRQRRGRLLIDDDLARRGVPADGLIDVAIEGLEPEAAEGRPSSTPGAERAHDARYPRCERVRGSETSKGLVADLAAEG